MGYAFDLQPCPICSQRHDFYTEDKPDDFKRDYAFACPQKCEHGTMRRPIRAYAVRDAREPDVQLIPILD